MSKTYNRRWFHFYERILRNKNTKENKSETFKRLSNNRVGNIKFKIDSLIPTFSSQNYEYDLKDVESVFSEIEKHLKETKTLVYGNLPLKQKRQIIEKNMKQTFGKEYKWVK